MGGHASLSVWDLAIFFAYLLVNVSLGFWVARRGQRSNTSRGYFLGDRKIPWHVVGASMVPASLR